MFYIKLLNGYYFFYVRKTTDMCTTRHSGRDGVKEVLFDAIRNTEIRVVEGESRDMD